jgi:hypothetical protein
MSGALWPSWGAAFLTDKRAVYEGTLASFVKRWFP